MALEFLMRFRAARMLSFGALLCVALCVHADEVRDRIEAAYLFRMTNYIHWPADSFAKVDAPIVIGVLGNASIAREAARLVRGQLANGHPISVRQITQPSDWQTVHMLYVDQALWVKFSAARERPESLIVTVSREIDADPGPMINFVQQDNHIRFDIAHSSANDAGIHFDADLLSVARQIR